MATEDATPRYYSATRGREVTWKEMSQLLDLRDAAYRGSNAWVFLGGIEIGEVIRIADFLCFSRYSASWSRSV